MRIRHDVASLTSADRSTAETGAWHPVLDTYARGVQLMRQLDPEMTPDSWIWAANTHGTPLGTPPRPAWGQCAHASRFFLPWHRAYLAWFESTIRRLTGDQAWGLPYWDYSVADNPSARLLPVEFAVETRTVAGQVEANPLFVPGRSPSPLPPVDVDIVPALSETRYVREVPDVGFGGADRDRFFGNVESLPHNFVHVDIGALMRSPATAARDPIFWLHHANVDRLWEVWRSLPGSVALTDPGGASALLMTQWRSAMFFFGDERSPTTYQMSELEDLGSPRMQYEYESTKLPHAIAEAVETARLAAAPVPGGGLTVDEVQPGWQPVAATFDLESGEERDVPFTVGPRGLDAAPPSRLVLELAGAQATDPHSAYVVEVRSAPDSAPHVAGRFSTFGLAGTPDTEERNYLVDASAVLPDLLAEGWTGGRLTVRVVPEPDRPDSADTDRSIHLRQVTVYLPTP
ncbi:MAG: tyrosinase family protein [Nocardioidaceae bacterium]